MMRKRRLPATPIMDLQEDEILRTQKLTSIQVSSASKNNHEDQVNQNKKFLGQILKYSNLAVKLPDSVTSRSVEEGLRSFNVKLASIASSKQILADYQKHFRGLQTFFKRMISQGEKLPPQQQTIWRMFFLNNMAVIAFNNGDYTTSLELLKQIHQQHKINQLKQPVFTLAITNLSAIYHKMDSKIKCFEYLQSAFQYSKKLLDGASNNKNLTGTTDTKLNSIFAIQSIMMIKHSQHVETPTHNIKQIEKLMIKLVKDSSKVSSTSMDIPYINKYLEQRKLLELKQLHSSIAGSIASSKRSRRKSYHLESINYQGNNQVTGFSQQVLSQNTQIDSPVKRYSYNKIRQEIDQLNTKVNRLQLQNTSIQSTLKQILQTLKNPHTLSPMKQNESKGINLIQNIEKALDVSHVASRGIFKTLQVFIFFFDQGIKLKTFTNQQQKLSWGQLQNIFKLLDLFHLYLPYLQLNPTRHTIAWIISKYLTIENGIKIKRQPWPILRFQHQKKKYGLYHIRQRQFTIYGSDIQAIVFEMSQKSFNYYFNCLKHDQYQAWSMSYFDREPEKIQDDYFMQVIQLKSDVNFEEDIQDVFGNFKSVFKQTINNASSYKKVKLWFDESARDDITFFGVLYIIYNNTQKQQLQYNLYPLNAYQGIKINQPITKIFTYVELESKYSVNLNQKSSPYLNYVYINLADTINIRIQSIKRDGKIKYVVHGVNQNTQCVYFEQRMILKKYYKPIFIFILRTKSRYISIRFSSYNQAQITTLNVSVVLNMYIPKKLDENSEEIAKKFVKIKEKVKTNFLSKLFGQLETEGEAKSFIHVEELISMIEAETKNWGQ